MRVQSINTTSMNNRQKTNSQPNFKGVTERALKRCIKIVGGDYDTLGNILETAARAKANKFFDVDLPDKPSESWLRGLEFVIKNAKTGKEVEGTRSLINVDYVDLSLIGKMSEAENLVEKTTDRNGLPIKHLKEAILANAVSETKVPKPVAPYRILFA